MSLDLQFKSLFCVDFNPVNMSVVVMCDCAEKKIVHIEVQIYSSTVWSLENVFPFNANATGILQVLIDELPSPSIFTFRACTEGSWFWIRIQRFVVEVTCDATLS